MDLIPKNHLAFVVMKNQLWICGLQSRKDLNLIKVNEIKDQLTQFPLHQNKTGPEGGIHWQLGVHVLPFLRTPGADLKRDVIEAIGM